MGRLNWKYLIVGVVLAPIVFAVSVWVFPASGRSVGAMLALGVVVVAGVMSFLANLRKVTEAPAAPAAPEAGRDVIKATGDVQTGGTRIQAPVSGDVAGHDIIKQEAPPPALNLHQLPAPPRDFTGRTAEMTELLAKLEQGGVTISGLQGMGGVGKTALALKLAEALMPRYPDAQFFLDLRGTSTPLSPAEAMGHVIRGYHPASKLPESEDELCGLYRTVLHGQRALVLMDNARGAAQVEPLIPPAGCALLVTSRWHFHLPGLYAKNLDVLSAGDAEGLLLKIAPRIDGHAGEMAKLCGYLPLALRLAGTALAERMTLSVGEYVGRLQDAQRRLELVDASLTLSYELLSPELQRFWGMLAVFPGTFDRAGAAAVWGMETEAAQDVLDELVRYSLVEWNETAGRYSLHDLVRVFAATRLSEDDRAAVQRRHAAHYKNVAAAANELYMQGGESITRGLGLFDLEWGNIEVGQAWAAGHAGEDDAAARLCCDYPKVGWYCLELRQHPREKIRWLEVAMAAARRLGDHIAESGHLGDMGAAYAALGDARRAIEFYEQQLVIVREIGDRGGEGNALGNMGVAYADLGDARRAIELYEQALVIDREIGDRHEEGNALGNMGVAYAALGAARRAIELCEQRLVIAREIGDRLGEGAGLNNLGEAYAASGETQRAIEFYQHSLAIERELGNRLGEGISLFNLGQALDTLGDRAQAIAHGEVALKLFEQIEAPNANEARKQLAEWGKKNSDRKT